MIDVVNNPIVQVPSPVASQPAPVAEWATIAFTPGSKKLLPLLLLGFVLFAGILFTGYWFIFSNSVKAVYVTDNSPEGLGVVWQTSKAANSYLVSDEGWKTQLVIFRGKEQQIKDVIDGNHLIHLARLKNLSPNTTFALRIVVNGLVKEKVQIKTSPPISNVPTPMPLLGEVVDQANKHIKPGVVLVQLVSKTDRSKQSILLASNINEEGKFAVDLSNIRTKDLKSAFKYDSNTDRIQLTLLFNNGASFQSLTAEEAFGKQKYQFTNFKAYHLKGLINKVYAGHFKENEQTPSNFCEGSNVAGEDENGEHYFIEDCGDRECSDGQCVNRAPQQPAPEPEQQQPAPAPVPVPPDADGGSVEDDKSEYDKPENTDAGGAGAEISPNTPQGTAGVQLIQTAPVQPELPVAQPISTPTPIPSPKAATAEGLIGVTTGAESVGANVFTIIGSAHGNVTDKELNWQVDFGDGSSNTYTSKNPLRTPKTYSKSGIYTVTISVTDPSSGKSFTNQVAVSVQTTPTNSLSGIIPPPASPKTSEDSIAVDLNTREITTKASWGRTTMDALAVLRATQGDPQATSGAISIRYANSSKEAVIVIKNGKIVERYDINPSTGKRISLRQSYVAGAAISRVLGVSDDKTSVEVVQLSSGQVAVSLPEGDVSISAELGGKRVEIAKGYIEAGKFYEVKPNLAGKDGEIKLSAGQLSLESGWNLVALNVTPKKDYMAEDILQEINAQGGKSVAVNRWIDNKWQTHVVGNFGTNFKIEVGHGYFVYAKAASTWFVPANNDITHPDVLIDPGWNLLATTNLSITKASELLNHININSTPSVDADTVTQYVNNLWQSIKLKDGVVFGKDYEVANSRSYFVKSQNQGAWRSK